MKSLRGSGGVIGRGLSENVTKVWTRTVHIFTVITVSIETLTSFSDDNIHQDLQPGRILRDNEEFVKILQFFYVHNSFCITGCLQSFNSGLIDEGKVNCDKAEEIGSKIQEAMGERHTA